MSFKAKFYLIFLIVVLTSVYIIDQILGKLYVRYMILFTAALFLIGMQYGGRAERMFREKLDKMRKDNKEAK